MGCSPPGPPSMEFSRQEYYSGLPFPSPGSLPDPGIKPRFPTLQADSFLSHQGSPLILSVFKCLFTYFFKLIFSLMMRTLKIHSQISLVVQQIRICLPSTVEHMEICSMWCGSLDGRGGWGRMDTWMTESLCCLPETITTLLIYYIPLQNKKLKQTKKQKPPANAGNTGFTAGPGTFHMLRSNQALVSQLLSLHAATTEASTPRACVLQQEKPLQWEVCTPKLETSSPSPQLEKACCSNEDPARPKK